MILAHLLNGKCALAPSRLFFNPSMLSMLYPTGSLWLIDAYGPVYFETTSLVVGHHTIKVWQAMIHATIECVAFLSAVHAHMLTSFKAAHLSRLKRPSHYGIAALLIGSANLAPQ